MGIQRLSFTLDFNGTDKLESSVQNERKEGKICFHNKTLFATVTWDSSHDGGICVERRSNWNFMRNY